MTHNKTQTLTPESVDSLTDIDDEFPLSDSEALLYSVEDTVCIPVAIGPSTRDNYTIVTKFFDVQSHHGEDITVSSSHTDMEMHTLSEFLTLINSRETTVVDKQQFNTATQRTITGTLHFDGASRGNPGDASTGYVLTGDMCDGDDEIRDGEYLGSDITNNQAEYEALQSGLERAIEHGVTDITIYGDSQLIVKQVTGEYNCNNNVLQQKLNEVTTLLDQFDTWSIEQVPRNNNNAADGIANTVLDNAQ